MHLIRDLTILYQPFKYLTIVVKKLLAVNGLNQPYHGGLSSFSTALWVTASLNYN